MKRRAFLGLLSATTASVIAPNSSANNILRLEAGGVLPSVTQSPAEAVRFIAFGDSGKGDRAQYELARMMVAHHWSRFYDTALMLGDNIYPDGDWEDMPAKFEGPYGELLRRGVSFHAVLGNHDIKKGQETQIRYPKFNMGGRSYYSFTKGDGLVDFFALDSNRFDHLQRRWLEVALMASRARWKVAYFHHPIYSSAERHGSDVDLRSELEPLLVRYGVDAAFSGHDHIYERTTPQKGIQYFVSGAGSKPRRGDLDRRTPFFAAGNDETSSFMSIEVTPDRFSFKTIDAGGRVIDSGELASRAAASAATLSR
ncbi:MAG TPA: metallophosphoesterase [Blastocatellia bacterium]|nr:metallophosphoesterase [Blastocatellia bacterium]